MSDGDKPEKSVEELERELEELSEEIAAVEGEVAADHPKRPTFAEGNDDE